MLSRMFDVARIVWRRSGAKRLYVAWGYGRLLREWAVLRKVARDRSLEVAKSSVVILPPDPFLLCASKGDQAMLSVLIEGIRSRFEGKRIVVGTCGDLADHHAHAFGIDSIRALDNHTLANACKMLLAANPSHLFLVGADVLDGSYDPRFSLRLLALTDLAARSGVSCTVTGFSFSDDPFSSLRHAYSEMDPSVKFYIRDPVSQIRFDTFSSALSVGVSDIAFLLPADRNSSSTTFERFWIERRRASGRNVIGLNVHPLLLGHESGSSSERFLAKVAESVYGIARDCKTSFVLVSHDFRGSSSDSHYLDPLYSQLAPVLGDDLMIVRNEYTASEIKGLVAQLDGVVSGRMHLAIAALGSGVPVLGINYKDKMEGLFEHFGLDRKYVVPAEAILRSDTLGGVMTEFIRELSSLRESVEAQLPRIRRLAEVNLSSLDIL